MREYPEVQKPTSRPSSGLSPLRRIGDSSMISVNWNLKISALCTLPTRIWKHFVIQTKAGIFPGEAIIVEHGKLAITCNYEIFLTGKKGVYTHN
jgi:hypothetical protein